MSVTKAGSDDHNCGLTNHDLLHQAICRVVAGGHHGRRRGGQRLATTRRPTSRPATTRSSPSRPWPTPTASRAASVATRCFSWGGYDKDDTFADFSNYGADVDLIAPGKCIRSTIPGGYGTCPGRRWRRRRSPAPSPSTSRAGRTPRRPRSRRRSATSATSNWKTSTDPDSTHEPLLDVSRLGNLGTFALAPSLATHRRSRATTRLLGPVQGGPQRDFLRARRVQGHGAPGRLDSGPPRRA